MTHSTLLLLAASNADSHLVTLYAREARELVSQFDALLEERDALSAQARTAEKERDEKRAVLSETFTALVRAGPDIGDYACHDLPTALARLTKQRDAARAQALADRGFQTENDRLWAQLSSAESEIVRMSERLRATTADWTADRATAARIEAVADAAESSLAHLRERVEALVKEWEPDICPAAQRICAALRSLVRGETNDKEKTR